MANSKQLLALSLLTATTAAELVTFSNQCDFTIELFHSQSGSAVAKVADIAPGATRTQDVSGPAHMFRHGFDTAATCTLCGLLLSMARRSHGVGWRSGRARVRRTRCLV